MHRCVYESMPALLLGRALHLTPEIAPSPSRSTELQGTNVFFLGINTDEDVALANKFLLKTPVNFLNVSDRTQKIVEFFQPKGFPTAYIVGKDGIVHTVKAGFAGKAKTKALLLELAAQ